MEAGGDFFGVAGVVQLQEALEDLLAGRVGEDEADALFGGVEAVVQGQVGPAVGGGDGVVHHGVQGPQGVDRGVVGRVGGLGVEVVQPEAT